MALFIGEAGDPYNADSRHLVGGTRDIRAVCLLPFIFATVQLLATA